MALLAASSLNFTIADYTNRISKIGEPKMPTSKITIAVGLTSLLLLAGCASTTDTNEGAESVDEVNTSENVAEEETTEASEFNENEITNRALICEDVLLSPDSDKASSEYKGCLLESEIPNLASFLSSEEPNIIYHILADGEGKVTEIVSFVDSDGDGKYTETEKIGSYLVPLDIMTIDVVGDSNPNIEGTQVSGLPSMTFSPAA